MAVIQAKLNFALGFKPRLNNPYVIELGGGTETETGDPNSITTNKAIVSENGTKGIAIGQDAFVNAPYGVGLGNNNKILESFGIGIGSGYLNIVQRKGEERRSFSSDSKRARGWLEFTANIPQGGGYSPIYLHGDQPVKMEPSSVMSINLKYLAVVVRASGDSEFIYSGDRFGVIQRSATGEYSLVTYIGYAQYGGNYPSIVVSPDGWFLQFAQDFNYPTRFVGACWYVEYIN